MAYITSLKYSMDITSILEIAAIARLNNGKKRRIFRASLGAIMKRIKTITINNLIILGIMCGTLLFYMLPESFFNSTLAESNCLHQIWFSKPCPGCGITRAVYYFIHLDFSRAIAYNPSIILLISTVSLEVVFRLKQTSRIKQTRFLFYVLFCISLFITYFLRMIH